MQLGTRLKKARQTLHEKLSEILEEVESSLAYMRDEEPNEKQLNLLDALLSRIEGYYTVAFAKPVVPTKAQFYQCVQCNQFFEKDEEFMSHINTAHQEPKFCPRCSYWTKDIQVLAGHLLKHHLDFELETRKVFYTCCYSGAKFTDAVTLCAYLTQKGEYFNRHAYVVQIFNTLNNYKYSYFKCHQCPSIDFSMSKDYKGHLRQRHKLCVFYSCPHCDKCYQSSKKLVKHIFSFHSVVDAQKRRVYYCQYAKMKFDRPFYMRQVIHFVQEYIIGIPWTSDLAQMDELNYKKPNGDLPDGREGLF